MSGERDMTAEERAKLDDIHDALFKPQPGGGPALIARIVKAVEMYEQASSVSRFFIRGFMTLSGLIAAWILIRDFFGK